MPRRTHILRPTAVAEKAVRHVINFERKRGWEAKDVSSDRKCGYDVRSVNKKDRSQYRCIEVKGKISKKLSTISLYIKLRQKLGRDRKNYYIYLVQDVEKRKPIVRFLRPDVIFRHLKVKEALVLNPRYYRRELVKG